MVHFLCTDPALPALFVCRELATPTHPAGRKHCWQHLFGSRGAVGGWALLTSSSKEQRTAPASHTSMGRWEASLAQVCSAICMHTEAPGLVSMMHGVGGKSASAPGRLCLQRAAPAEQADLKKQACI